jgi:hypothetical protein
MNNFANVATRLRFVGFVVGCAALMSVGCGSGGASSSTDAGGVDVTGTWTGAITDTSGGLHPMSLTVTQTGADVTGTGTLDTKALNVTGKVNAKVWSGSLSDAANKFATYSLTVENNSATGTGTGSSDGKVSALNLTR